MAKFSSDADVSFLQTLDSAPSALPPDLPKVGGVFEKSQLGTGLADKIKEAAERSKNRQHKSSGDQLQVDELAGSAGLRLADSKLGIAEDRLDKARALIKQNRFAEALKILDAVLQENAGHPTALYLKGLCEFKLDRAEAALQTITPVIRTTPLSLDSQMRQLRTDIREKMQGAVVVEVLGLCAAGKVDAGLRRIQALLGLDPAVPVYHFLRIHVLLSGNRVAESSAATEAASPYCQGADREVLDAMRREIRQRTLAAALEPARVQYRAMNWRKARKELERIRSEWGQEDLWQIFYRYLEALGGGFLSKGRRPAEVRLSGDAHAVDQLQFLLVREELAQAKSLMDSAEPAPALQVLLAGYNLAPYHPYLHYMLGQASYLDILMHFATGDLPPIEVVEQQLQKAHQFATFGAQDPEIGSTRELIEAIEVAQRAMAEVRAEQQRMERDASLIRPLGDEFISVIDSAKDGIQSVEHFEKMRTRLRAVRSNIPGVLKKVATDQGRDALRQLGEAVGRNLGQLDKMEPEMRTTGEIIGFQKQLKSIMDGGPSRGSLAGVEKSLRDLKGQVENYKRSHSLQGEAKEALDGLITTIGNLQGDLAEAELVNPFIQKFEAAVAPLKNGRPLDLMGALTMKKSMSSIVTEGSALLRRLQKPQARKSVQDVISVAQDIVGKIQM